MDRVDLSAIDSMVEDLRKSFNEVAAAQQELTRVTGTAWSDDHLIKVVVGPRGQLVGLEIDPRAVRRVNTEALAATILATARAAAEDAAGHARDLVDRDLPDLRTALGADLPGAANLARMMFAPDADLIDADRRRDREHDE